MHSPLIVWWNLSSLPFDCGENGEVLTLVIPDNGDNVAVKHHERQPAIPFKGIVQAEADDGLPFPIFQPEILRDWGIVFIGFAVPLDPGVELALCY